MIIPLSTDAPVYHWPGATLGLIGANVLAFIATGGGAQESWDVWMLAFGDGLHPTQWVLCNFLHFGIIHLVGNMIFLWGFGLVVEGKIGWQRFLLVYFGIGIGHAAVEQTLMLGYTGLVQGSGGASAVVYGLLAMSLIWAPENEVTCGLLFFFRVYVFDLTIRTFALIYLGVDFLTLSLKGFAMSSELLHLLGAAFGLVFAIGMLKLDWVDCEKWDLFSVLKGEHKRRDEIYDSFGRVIGTEPAGPIGKTKKTKRKSRPAAADDSVRSVKAKVVASPFGEQTQTAAGGETVPAGQSLVRLVKLLENQQPSAALSEYRRLTRLNSHWRLPERELFQLAAALDRAGQSQEAVPLMEEYLERFGDERRSVKVRLRLAHFAVKEQQRPRYALRLLKAIPSESLDAGSLRIRQSLEKQAQRLIDEGVLELDGQAWS